MTSANVTIVKMVNLLIGGLVFYEVSKPVASPHKHSPACKNMDIVGVKKGIIVKTEADGRYVYVSKKWERGLPPFLWKRRPFPVKFVNLF